METNIYKSCYSGLSSKPLVVTPNPQMTKEEVYQAATEYVRANYAESTVEEVAYKAMDMWCAIQTQEARLGSVKNFFIWWCREYKMRPGYSDAELDESFYRNYSQFLARST